ncbi:unnamed protein product [Schistosoma curassoni]|uniref:Uncharacterized protein n=1 Tax=Schistosoma curassoni TaxID=6186 RepID=A0A183KLP9_9TREM|nr:unnamed protein product [Schistosoma curassoni]
MPISQNYLDSHLFDRHHNGLHYQVELVHFHIFHFQEH